MPITETQREQRQRHIGSSDVAAVMGRDPYRTPYDVWLEKLGHIEADQDANEAADIGSMIEDSLLDWGAAELGVKIRKNQRRVFDGGVLAANHDALVVGQPWGLEAKTTGIINPFVRREEWGDEGTDQLPDRILFQCHQQMIVSDLQRIYVPALIGGRGRVLFVVERHEELQAALVRQLFAWWSEHVEKRTPPPDVLPSLDVLKRVRREPSSICDLDLNLVLEWQGAKLAVKEAEAREEKARAAMLAALGTNEAGRCSYGTITYLTQERRSLDAKALKAAHSEIHAKFERVTTSPTLRFKAAKEA